MSEIRATTISNAAGTGPITLTKQSAAKAWASVDQLSTGHPTYDSLNISSTSDIGTGKTQITFSTSMDNADYAIAGAGQADGSSGGYFSTHGKSGQGSSSKMTSALFYADNRDNAGGNCDLKYMSFSVHGDLA